MPGYQQSSLLSDGKGDFLMHTRAGNGQYGGVQYGGVHNMGGSCYET